MNPSQATACPVVVDGVGEAKYHILTSEGQPSARRRWYKTFALHYVPFLPRPRQKRPSSTPPPRPPPQRIAFRSNND